MSRDTIIPSKIVHPGELAQFPLNSNDHPPSQIDELVASRQQFSQYRNVVIWTCPADTETTTAKGEPVQLKRGVSYVLAGNSFHLASIKHSDESIEVKDYSHLSLDEAILLAETDNAAPLGSTRDAAQMVANLDRARALYVDDERMSRMLDRAREMAGANGMGAGSGEDTEPQVDKAEALQEKWQVKLGDVWQCGEHRLVCGDCTDPVVVEMVLQGEVPLLMVTDPPYGVNYDPDWRTEAAQKGFLSFAPRRTGIVHNDDRTDWSDAYLLFPGDVAYTWSPGGHPVILTGLAMQKAGFEIRNQIMWRKPHFPISRGHYTYQHEPCWYGVRKGKKSHWIGDNTASTVWEIPLDKNVDGGHSTQKPLENMARPIRNHEGDVYDPFLGSGTTLIAAHNLNRKCRAVEISPAYVSVALQRFLDHTGQHPQRVSE